MKNVIVPFVTIAVAGLAHGAINVETLIYDPSAGSFYANDTSTGTESLSSTINQDDLIGSDGNPYSPDNYSASASATADYGVLKAGISETRDGTYTPPGAGPSHSWEGGVAENSELVAAAQFIDTLTIDAAGKTGESGTVEIAFDVDGTLGLLYEGYDDSFPISGDPSEFFEVFAFWDLYIGAPDSVNPEDLQAGASGFVSGGAGGTFGGFDGVPDGTYTFEQAIVFGESFQLEYSLVTLLNVENLDFDGGTIIGEAVVNFTQTATLGDISVKDSEGNLVGASGTSTSGTEYSLTPVPEPLHFGLVAGIAVLGIAARRRYRYGLHSEAEQI